MPWSRCAYYVIPPPALPQPAVSALAVPTTSLSKKPVVQTWQGTKLAPRMPTKNLRAIRPLELVTKPAMAVGIEPASKMPMKTKRGPKRSHSGPEIKRMRRLESSVPRVQSWSRWIFTLLVERRCSNLQHRPDLI